MRTSQRILGRIQTLISDQPEIQMHRLSRASLANVAATGNRAAREHAKQFLGSSNSRCAYITREVN